MPQKTHQIGSRVSEDMFNWIQRTCKSNDVSASDIIIYALEAIKSKVEAVDAIRQKSPLERLFDEDKFMYVIVKNNGSLKLERVEKKEIDFAKEAVNA